MKRKSSWIVLGFVLAVTAACNDLDEPPLDEGTGAIQGTVKDQEAAAVPDAMVYILSNVSFFSRTDGAGSFTLLGVPAGQHTVVAVSDAGLATSAEVTVFGGKTANVDMTLAEAGRLSGTITLEGETNHSGTLVYLPGTSFVGYTDSYGGFTLYYVAPGCYSLRAEHEGFLPKELGPICIEAGQERALNEITLLLMDQVECLSDDDCGPHQSCSNNACVFEQGYEEEACDGKDNDGDGFVDEGLAHLCGSTDEGICKPGVSLCLGGGMSGCLGAVLPENEVCDDLLDNDCDGETDEPECFYLKIMFIVDSSGSMQQTDEDYARVDGVREVVRHFSSSPEVLFNVIKFNGRIASLTRGFKRLSGDETDVFGPQGLLEADSMTDYQGALSLAKTSITDDINATEPATVKRTKYMIVFFSDGLPDPVCDGCVTDPPDDPLYLPECELGHDSDVRCCHTELQVVCVLMGDIVLDMDYRESGMFPFLENGTNYNHDDQILGLVDSIRGLNSDHRIGDIQLHTGYLYCRDENGNPTTPLCQASEQAYNLDPVASEALLKEMARRGGGTYTYYTAGSPISFMHLDYSQID